MVLGKIFIVAKVESYKEETRKFDTKEDVDAIYSTIEANNKKVLVIKQEIANTDIGSFKFIARAFNTDLDSVVKYFILVIVIVFDPLAVTLVLAYNVSLLNRQDDKGVKP